ncbi:glycogenin glucosyltransferase glg1 [Sparganum proliferum]
MTQENYFHNASNGVCNADLTRIPECQKIADGSSEKIPCLFEHKQEVNNHECQMYLNLVGEIILSDFRLVYGFIDSCRKDIERFKCGRVSMGPVDVNRLSVLSQGETINCLSLRIEKLDSKCAHQIFRISELQSDDFHLDRPLFYACREDRERLCGGIVSGDGRVFDCLMSHKFDEGMSSECRQHLTKRQRLRSHNYRADHGLTNSCAKEIAENKCDTGAETSGSVSNTALSSIMLCLEAAKDANNLENSEKRAISGPCFAKMREIRKQLMEDYSLTPEIIVDCQVPIERFCQNYKSRRQGKVLHCLLGLQRSIPMNLESPLPEKCQHAIHNLLKIGEVVEDIRVDPVIRAACAPVLAGQCNAAIVEADRVYGCLIGARRSPSMPDECKYRLFELEFIVSRDITLDKNLFQACARDAEKLCHFSTGSWRKNAMVDQLLANCLWSHRHPTAKPRALSPACLVELSRLMLIRASSIDLSPEVFQVCLADLGRFCLPNSRRHVALQEASRTGEDDDEEREAEEQGMSCLEDHLRELQAPCREAVINYAKDIEEEPDLDQRIATACVAAEDRFCSGVRQSVHNQLASVEVPAADREAFLAEAQTTLRDAMFRCLVEHKNHPRMEPQCRSAVEHFQIISLNDVRISPGFYLDCQQAIKLYCEPPPDPAANMKPVTQSKMEVVACLSRKLLEFSLLPAAQENSSSATIPPRCLRHLRFELLSRAESIHLDPELDAACHSDWKRYCGPVESGQGEVIECLRQHRRQLSSKCHAVVFDRDRLAMIDRNADYKLMSLCESMAHLHCSHLVDDRKSSRQQAPEADLLDCLHAASTSSVHADTFDPQCRQVVVERLKMQRMDFRLDSKLNKHCRMDMKVFCSEEVKSDSASSFDQGNKVLTCLMKQYIASSMKGRSPLTRPCASHIRALLIAANLNHHMDPVLVELCHGDLHTYCSEELALSGLDGDDADGLVGECLRRQVALKRIHNASCVNEVLNLNLASHTDIDVDPVLMNDCAETIRVTCDKVAPGNGRRMKCLLAAMDDPSLSDQVDAKCRRSLTLRQDLWAISAKLSGTADWRKLAAELNASTSRNLIFAVALAVIGLIFIFGLLCGRVTRRVPVDLKEK